MVLESPESGVLSTGAVYSVFEGNQELTRVNITQVQKQMVLAKPLQGMPSIGAIQKAKKEKRPVILKPIGKLASDYAPLRMKHLDIHVSVMANLAVTTLTMTFQNDLNRVLEGSLNFPLGEGQTVSRFAMTVNGVLREGVAVEKTKGRQVFEDIIRKSIDPGLLEWTKGNVFKARVYPIPAKGEKKIVVAYEQELHDIGNGYLYNLPLDFEKKVDDFRIKVDVINQDDPPILVRSELATLQFQRWNQSWTADMHTRNYLPNQDLSFVVPKFPHVERVFVEEEDGNHYFYMNFSPQVIEKRINKPGKVTILWDASLSGRNRDHEKELEILGNYLSYLQNVQVELLVFRNAPEPMVAFNVQNGNWTELYQTLKALHYDGGTQLGVLKLPRIPSDQYLLFTDGISNFGQHKIQLGNTPVFAINSSSAAEHGYLRYVSHKTGGNYLNLAKLTPQEALGKLVTRPYMFLRATHDAKLIRETYPQTQTPVE